MAVDISTASGINTLVQQFMTSEVTKRVEPLNTKVTSYGALSSAWTALGSAVDSFKSAAYDLQSTSSDTYFGAKAATSTNSAFVTATATKDASIAAFTMRVNQLAKNDIAVSNSMASATAVTNMAGKHTLQFTNGDYTSKVDVTLTDSETNATVMQKISDAVNGSKAIVNSAAMDASSIYTGSGSFKINLNGTDTAIDYDYSGGKTYAEVIDDMATKINAAVPGVTAEKIVDGSNVNLRLTVGNSSQYISIDQTSDTGTLLNSSNFNMSATKIKAASGIVSTAVFTPSSGNSKLSLTSKTSGYDNRLQMTDASGSALSFLGLDSGVLSAHTKMADDNSAGFVYTVNSSTDNQLNAKVVFNGINVQSNSNTLDSLANGVTLVLKSVMIPSDSDVTVNVGSDVSTVKNKIYDFMSKFNKVYSAIKSRSNTDTTGRGVFVSDPSASALLNTLRTAATSKVAGLADGNLSYLSQIGITFDPASGVSLTNDSLLTDAITNKPTQLANMFNSSSGIASTLYSKLSRYAGADGSIAKTQASITSSTKYLNDKITTTQAQIEKQATSLRNQYNRLQAQLANMTSAYYTWASFSGVSTTSSSSSTGSTS